MDHGLAEAQHFGITRSPEWHHVEKAFRGMHPHCTVCSANNYPVQVHHIIPFHYTIALGRPDLELDIRNLISLCETTKDAQTDDHHLLIGHLGNFKLGNLNVIQCAIKYKAMTQDQIKHNLDWPNEPVLRALNLMSDIEKDEFKGMMERLYPKL